MGGRKAGRWWYNECRRSYPFDNLCAVYSAAVDISTRNLGLDEGLVYGVHVGGSTCTASTSSRRAPKSGRGNDVAIGTTVTSPWETDR